jgi:hypothetical protein
MSGNCENTMTASNKLRAQCYDVDKKLGIGKKSQHPHHTHKLHPLPHLSFNNFENMGTSHMLFLPHQRSVQELSCFYYSRATLTRHILFAQSWQGIPFLKQKIINAQVSNTQTHLATYPHNSRHAVIQKNPSSTFLSILNAVLARHTLFEKNTKGASGQHTHTHLSTYPYNSCHAILEKFIQIHNIPGYAERGPGKAYPF